MFKTFLLGCAFLALPFSSLAQLSHGGSPLNWGQKSLKFDVAHQQLKPLTASESNKVVNTAYEVGQAFQYGVQRMVNIDFFEKAESKSLLNGKQVWRLAITSPDAAMLSLQFSEFDLEPGAQLFLYNKKRTSFIGSFTEANEQPTGDWASTIIPGETVIIEYVLPANAQLKAPRALKIESITHGVLDLFGYGEGGLTKDYWPGYASAGCHNNIVCPVAAGWEQQGSSVAMFLRPDGAGCTGTMLNNTNNDGKPYFYLANHCYQPTESQWVFYFNYDSPTCQGDTGQTMQTMVGASYRASDYYDDFALVELFNQPPAAWNVYLSGWDRSNAMPSSTACILHPAYDVKKFAYDDDAPGSGQGGFGTGVWSTAWESGGIEAVGSGSPLFDQNKRVIGCMTGAWNSCNPGGGGLVSKLADQWDGVNPNGRLRDWLDPSNTAQAIDGLGSGGTPPPPPTAGVEIPMKMGLQGPMNGATGLMNDALRTSGLIPMQEPYTSLGLSHINGGGGETADQNMINTAGNLAPVDWVFVELRNASNWSVVEATRAGMLLANGKIVEPDENTPLVFNVAPGNYFIAIQHRNHLPIISGNAIAIANGMSTIDFTNMTEPIHGGTDAVVQVGTKWCLYAGDTSRDRALKYTGNGNDRDIILIAVGGGAPTNTVSGYLIEDVNLDGVTKFAGQDNDRDLILQNIGGNSPTIVRTSYYPQ